MGISEYDRRIARTSRKVRFRDSRDIIVPHDTLDNSVAGIDFPESMMVTV